VYVGGETPQHSKYILQSETASRYNHAQEDSLSKLSEEWVSDLRDLFLAEGQYTISQGALWAFHPSDNVWRPFTYEEMPRLASTFLDHKGFQRPGSKGWIPVIDNINHRRELAASLWTRESLWDHAFFASAPPGLAVGKQFLVVSPDNIHAVPLTDKHRVRHALDIELPPNFESLPEPKYYVGALRRMFGDDEDGEKKILAFQEFVGACRTGIVTSYERCIIMPGGGSNGKSTIIMGAAESIFSKHERRSIVPNFMNQEYYLMQLRDAVLNAVTELPKEQVNCTERFKQIISGEDVTGRPIREMPVTFKPTAGHIFACNNFPKLSDNSRGMWRRLLVLRSDASFAKNDGLRADLVEQFRKEAPQILVWALRGAQRLMRQGDYTFPDSHTEEERLWRGANDKVLQFVTKCTKGFDSGWSKASAACKTYNSWITDMGFPWTDRMDPSTFGTALKHLEGFQSKRQSYGMAYNLVVKPRAEWIDFHSGEGHGEVTLEEEST